MAETESVHPFTLNTNAFLDEGALPVLYTCDGKNESPQLEWTGAPDKTQAFALLITDQNAPNAEFYHWVIYNLPKTTLSLDQGVSTLPAGTTTAKNSWGNPKYEGPCPPKGAAHTYEITLYALDNPLNLPASANAETIKSALEKHMIGKTHLTTVYSRWLE
ncbi:MAG: hypothetical protein A3E85_05435 [Gammaproteobacteria bacterium RIFCSPHIGHO2_12_FULL_45_12]|nr:MAG: hypothetical protein A3E85_05435 [Gammaproteobacteria bacterium RIFCSPHIGHO2_12_FULL_45_12]